MTVYESREGTLPLHSCLDTPRAMLLLELGIQLNFLHASVGEQGAIYAPGTLEARPPLGP